MAVTRMAEVIRAILMLILWVGPAGAEVQESSTRPSPNTAPIHNGGFESEIDGWSAHVYGAPARLEFNGDVVRERSRALRISSADPSDAAVGQDLLLRPRNWYRFTGWVRTRGLDPREAPVYGTFQIQRPDGVVITTGQNHGADTDWVQVPLVFQAPADGRIRVGVFFVGYGKGTGTAWFDDLRLEEMDVAKAPLRITRDLLTPAHISGYQYGQFIEYLCDMVPAMWAEKLYDSSFEGLSAYAFEFIKETDFREKPWYPSGAVNRAEYAADPVRPVNGKVAKRMTVSGDMPCTVGISQDGIYVERDKPCLFSVYLRQQDVKEPVTVQLHHEARVYAAATFQPDGEWKKYTVRLMPLGSDANATLSITFRGPGTVWLDNGSLMPEDSVGGWRRDVVEAVRALKPGIIRFGGTALEAPSFGDFEWRDTIGDSDRRKPLRAWGGLQPAGAGLEEIVQFCRHVGAEPLICVRVTGRTPEDAAKQVEYFNGPADTPMGRLRYENGHPEPYRIKHWQVGNELFGPEYEARLRAFCAAMKKADPTILLLSSYPSGGIVQRAGDLLDYVAPHHYDVMNLSGTERNLHEIRGTLAAFAKGKNIKVAVTEWNTTAGDIGPRRARLWSLENALAVARYHNLLHRHCDLVEIANRSNLANSFCSGIVQTDNHRLYKTPAYYAQQLYATLAGTRLLKIDSDALLNAAPDLSATLSAEGDVVTIFAVNPDADEVARPLDFSMFGNGGQDISVWTLADREGAKEPDATNSFAKPDRISPIRATFKAPSVRFVYRFPPLSLTVMRWRVNAERGQNH